GRERGEQRGHGLARERHPDVAALGDRAAVRPQDAEDRDREEQAGPRTRAGQGDEEIVVPALVRARAHSAPDRHDPASGWRRWRWKRSRARLCWASVSLNWCVPSLRLTK